MIRRTYFIWYNLRIYVFTASFPRDVQSYGLTVAAAIENTTGQISLESTNPLDAHCGTMFNSTSYMYSRQVNADAGRELATERNGVCELSANIGNTVIGFDTLALMVFSVHHE